MGFALTVDLVTNEREEARFIGTAWLLVSGFTELAGRIVSGSSPFLCALGLLKLPLQ